MDIEILTKQGNRYITSKFESLEQLAGVMVKLGNDGAVFDDDFIVRFSEIAEIYPKGYHNKEFKINIGDINLSEEEIEELLRQPIVGIDGCSIKPPLGIKAEFIFLEERKKALEECIKRHTESNCVINPDWAEELNIITNRLSELENKGV